MGTGTGIDSFNSAKHLPIEELGAYFVESLTEVIAKVSGFSLDVLSSDIDVGCDSMIAVMNINGSPKGGMIFLSAVEKDVRILTSFMTGVAQEEITKDDMYDTLCELVNMTAGNVKLRISNLDYMFMLSMPFAIAINGENMSIITKPRMSVISKVLGNGEITIKLKVVY